MCKGREGLGPYSTVHMPLHQACDAMWHDALRA